MDGCARRNSRGGLWACRAALILVLLLAGCLSPEAKRQALLNEARCERFIDLLRRGSTTREEERRFIVENGRAWTAFRRALGIESPWGEEDETPERRTR